MVLVSEKWNVLVCELKHLRVDGIRPLLRFIEVTNTARGINANANARAARAHTAYLHDASRHHPHLLYPMSSSVHKLDSAFT
jgi:hypothetical protein